MTMSGDQGRIIFDPELLDGAAGKLKESYQVGELREMLTSGLLDRPAFGEVDGAPSAHDRLTQAFDDILRGMRQVGVDVDRLAADAMTAAQQARDAEAEAYRLALEAALGPVAPFIADTFTIPTRSWTD